MELDEDCHLVPSTAADSTLVLDTNMIISRLCLAILIKHAITIQTRELGIAGTFM